MAQDEIRKAQVERLANMAARGGCRHDSDAVNSFVAEMTEIEEGAFLDKLSDEVFVALVSKPVVA